MMSKLEKHYTDLNQYLNLITFLHHARIINSNRYMATVIELHNKPHNLIMGG